MNGAPDNMDRLALLFFETISVLYFVYSQVSLKLAWIHQIP